MVDDEVRSFVGQARGHSTARNTATSLWRLLESTYPHLTFSGFSSAMCFFSFSSPFRFKAAIAGLCVEARKELSSKELPLYAHGWATSRRKLA